MNYIYAIKIYLDGVYATNDDLGIYTVSGKSYIKWSELPIYGASVTGTWKSGILSGLSPISYTADCQNKGAVVSAGAYTVDAFNTDQLSLKLYELGIHLNGLKCERVLFVGTDSDSDSVSSATVHTGLIDLSNGMQWSETNLSFTVKTGMHKRNANITEKADAENGDIIPVTFGASSPVDGLYFKAPRTDSTYEIQTLTDLTYDDDESIYPPGLSLFPVVEKLIKDTVTQYKIALGNVELADIPDCDLIIGKFVLVKEGAGSGEYREVIDCTLITFGNPAIVQIKVNNYFETDLVGNYTATATNQSWIEFIDVDRKYLLDNISCVGFFNDIDVQLFKEIDTFALDEDEIVKLPKYGYDNDGSNENNNTIKIDLKFFKNTPDDMTSFIIFPPDTFERYNEPTLTVWNSATESWWSLIDKQTTAGIYSQDTIEEISDIVQNGTESLVKDKLITTFYEFNFHVKQTTNSVVYHKVFRIVPPELPDGIDLNAAYLGLYMRSECAAAISHTPNPPGFRIMKRGYFSRVVNCLDDKFLNELGAGGAGVFNIPDEYWIPIRSTYNRSFWTQWPYTTAFDEITKYDTIDLQCTSKAEFEAIEEIIIVMTRQVNAGYETDDFTKFTQVGFIIESSANVKKEMYV